MDFTKHYKSELIDIREQARVSKDWALSDKIRDYLDSKNTFIFDSKDGCIVYYELEGVTREDLIKKINKEIQGESIFNAWLYSTLSSNSQSFN